MKTRMGLSAHGGPVDRAEYGPMAPDETRIADEVEHGRPTVTGDDRRDEVGNCCKVDLVTLALQKTGRHEGEWARREQKHWLGDCERTWRSVLKGVVVQMELRGQESLYSLLVRLEEDESLRSGILLIEVWPSVALTRGRDCCHFDSPLALVESAIVHDKVQLHAVER